MAYKKERFCKRCDQVTVCRLVKSEGYYLCTVCTENNSKKHRKNNWYRYLAQKANARKNKTVEKLTEEDLQSLLEKQFNKCALTGIQFDLNSKWDKPSLDRIDPSKGYSKDNIRLVTWRVNHCKGELSDYEFVEMCMSVAENNTLGAIAVMGTPEKFVIHKK